MISAETGLTVIMMAPYPRSMAEVTESQVRARLAEVIDLIDRHELALAYLSREQADLEVTVRVFERFHERPDNSELLPSQAQVQAWRPAEPRKPEGIPTMPDMIIAALSEAARNTGAWLEPKQVAAVIRDRWWPDAPSTSVGPIAWRMAKEGRLKKEDTLYTIPENETPAGDTAGASEPGKPVSAGNLF